MSHFELFDKAMDEVYPRARVTAVDEIESRLRERRLSETGVRESPPVQPAVVPAAAADSEVRSQDRAAG